MKPVIEVSGLSKSYRISHQTEMQADYSTLKDDFANLVKKPFGGGLEDEKETFWALKDVSFEIKQGEAFGIIGKNGSGKSTLLKILSRIVEPTKGEIRLDGRVASLLEVGTGFHPELTGRENIFFNGSMLGMGRQEIRKKFNEIVDFSGVEKFLDTPVKFYSSGMYVRLAFAVAAHLDPEILILDEVLAVGDAQFQKKSLNKMMSIAKSGRTIIFVSHGLDAVEELCDRAMLLQNGKAKMIGDTEAVIGQYIEGDLSPSEKAAVIAAKKEAEISKSPKPGVIKSGKTVKVRAAKHIFCDFLINGKAMDQKIIIPSGHAIRIEASYSNEGLPSDLLIGYSIKNIATGDFPIYIHNKLENANHTTNKSGHITAKLLVPRLAPGNYSLEINVWLDDKMFVENEEIGNFRILETPAFSSKQVHSSFPSAILIDSTWSFSKD